MNKETGRNKGITYDIQKEIRRRRWGRQAKRQKKRWFSLAFKDNRKHESICLKQIVSSIGTLFFWAALGVIALICSWELFGQTGEASFADFYSSEKEEELMDVEYGKKEKEKEGKEHVNQEEDWFQEFFGVEIRFQDGKMTFFREKKGQMKEVK